MRLQFNLYIRVILQGTNQFWENHIVFVKEFVLILIMLIYLEIYCRLEQLYLSDASCVFACKTMFIHPSFFHLSFSLLKLWESGHVFFFEDYVYLERCELQEIFWFKKSVWILVSLLLPLKKFLVFQKNNSMLTN